MRYFDTSFLAPLIREEATSSRVERFIAELSGRELTVSRWTEVEFASLLARDVRMGVIAKEQADEANAMVQDMVWRSFIVLLPRSDDYELAREYLHHYESGLRAGDAFHLAIATNHGAEAIYSLDKTMIQAGKQLGLPVTTGVRLD
jgi:uncharacterized protein